MRADAGYAIISRAAWGGDSSLRSRSSRRPTQCVWKRSSASLHDDDDEAWKSKLNYTERPLSSSAGARASLNITG